MPSKRPMCAPGGPRMGNVNTLKSGQNSFGSGLCISTNLDGSRCMEKNQYKWVPYCAKCIKHGDPSLAVVPHPRFGRMLVTKRDLPKGYRAALWGEVMEHEVLPEEDEEWCFETSEGVNVNPCKYPSSMLQFSQCPGPHEKVTLRFAVPYDFIEPPPPGKEGKWGLSAMKKGGGKKWTRQEKFGSMMFVVTEDVPKNGQLNMMYAGGPSETDSFFEERGLTRCDVWTPKHPTLLKKSITNPPEGLKLVPPVAKSDREAQTVIKQVKGTTYNVMKRFSFDGEALDNKNSMKRGSSSKTVEKAPPKGTGRSSGGPSMKMVKA